MANSADQISWLLQKPTDLDLQFAKAGYIQVQQHGLMGKDTISGEATLFHQNNMDALGKLFGFWVIQWGHKQSPLNKCDLPIKALFFYFLEAVL